MTNLKKVKNQQPQSNIIATEKFKRHIIQRNAIATSDIRSEHFDIKDDQQKINNALIAMGAEGGLQSMLAAQMLSIHELQQRAMTYANGIDHLELKQYYTNAAIKLANCFTQQANTLAKLQGVGGQKITVERVDVHQGGQAIVGHVQGGMGKKEKT